MSKAEMTRLSILEKAFELIYAHGYQATSVDDIIANTQVTKGAFYHHFKNKDEMGLAVINELMYSGIFKDAIQELSESNDPAKDIYKMMKELLMENPFFQVKYGCPAMNLVEEMSPVSNTFRKALLKLVSQWQDALESSIQHGKKSGKIRKDVHAKQVALLVMSGYGGIRNLGKLYNDKACYKSYLKELKYYLKSLE
jgi:TetR/AcrR family transcriptional regulator, transcriptional repressor for nem operon